MKTLIIHQGELEAYAAKTQAAIDRAATDIALLDELEAQHAVLSARRADRVAQSFLANTTPDLTAIDAELDTLAAQIATLSDRKATHDLLSKQLSDGQTMLEVNQRHINKIIAGKMQERFEQGEQEFADAVDKLGNSLVKMQSALHVTRMATGRDEGLRDQYREYVGDGLYVRGLTRIAERDVAAEAQAAEMLEALKAEGVEFNF